MKLVAALLAVTAVVAQASDTQPLILGGKVVPAGKKTYTVGLRHSPTDVSLCGGSLISPTHVLTAGHCTGYEYVSIGSHYRNGSSDGERIAVKKETRHPDFYFRYLSYDFNVIELASPSKFTPVPLLTADPETLAGQTATALGWGRTTEGGTESNELMRVNVPVLKQAQCKAVGFTTPIDDSMFCAGGKANEDACQGDSGGPLILEQSTRDVLVGIVSWGDGCGTAGKPGVYARTSLVKNWILSLAPNAKFV
jgi:secreted trypsin-like serine protease